MEIKLTDEQIEDACHAVVAIAGETWKTMPSTHHDIVRKQIVGSGAVWFPQAMKVALCLLVFYSLLPTMMCILSRCHSKNACFTSGHSKSIPIATRPLEIKIDIEKTKAQAGTTATADNAAITNNIAQPYIAAFNTINQGFLQVQAKMILGTQSISRDFAQMGANLVVSVAGAFEKMLAKTVEYKIKAVIANEEANKAKLLSNKQAETAGTAIQQESAIKQSFIDAKGAAAGAFKWVMKEVPPPFSFALAPAAAAAAFAGTIAIAGFEQGGVIPNTGIALVHQGESVIPSQLTGLLLRAANSTTNNSSNSASQVNHFYGSTDKQFRDQGRRNADDMLKTVRRGARNLGRA